MHREGSHCPGDGHRHASGCVELIVLPVKNAADTQGNVDQIGAHSVAGLERAAMIFQPVRSRVLGAVRVFCPGCDRTRLGLFLTVVMQKGGGMLPIDGSN